MDDFDSQSFVDAASDILEEVRTGPGGDRQTRLRTVVGRAYYGAYGLIRRLIVQRCGDCLADKGMHAPLKDARASSVSPHLMRIGERLKKLLAFRIRPDYPWQQRYNIADLEAEDAVDTDRAACKKINMPQLTDLNEIHTRLS